MKHKTDPNALRDEELTLRVRTNQPPAVLRDVVKYWLYVHDRQVQVTKVTLTASRKEKQS